MNEENQVYLLNYSDSILVITLAKFYNFCGQKISKYPTKDNNDKSSNGAVVRECLFAVIKVLINLTHRFNRQCKRLLIYLNLNIKLFIKKNYLYKKYFCKDDV